MAKNFGARKNSKYKVVSSSPSVNKTPRGDSTPDVPYDVQQDLSAADAVSPNVFFNGDPVYVKTSHSTKVTGDEKGSKGGVKSGTVGAQSDPIEASPSVFVNGKAVVRVGDVQYMQNKNTVGKVTTSESGSAAHITDEGKIEGDTQPEPIAMPYAKNKPTNNSGTGTLGARTGSPVLLKSGKLLYRVSDAAFIAPIGFHLQRIYIGDARIGIFGNGWQCSYETRLIRTDPHTLSLTFRDDQVFRFSYSDKGFIDTDALGAKLTLLSAQTFLLEYYNEPRSELYVNTHLLEIKDLNGNTLNFVREANGKLVRMTSASASLTFEYNRNGHVSRIVDHTNRTWNYTYDKHYNLIEVIDPLAGVTYHRYGVQKPHLLERIIDPSNVTILEVGYDTTGCVLSYREGGISYTYRYEKNRVVKTEKVNGEARDTTLGCEVGYQTFYGLDDWGVIRAITYPDGSTTREEFNDGTSVTVDQGGNSYSKVFDERHRLIREVSADKRETLYIYDRNNPNYTSMTRWDKIIARTFDERYNLLSVTYHDKSKEMYAYDDRGNMVSETDRSGSMYSYAYNDFGQHIRVSDALGGVTQYVYDELGNMTTIIDPMERITRFEYDKLSRLIVISDNAKNTIRLYYDKAGRYSALTDALGNTTRYAYDENGFLAREILPNGESRTFTYERGLRTSMTLEDGKNIRMDYDKMRRLISRTIGDKTTRTTYDTLGNILSVDDGTTVVEYVYDVNANIVLERLGDDSVSYAYNADGTRRFIGYANAHYMLKRDESGNLSEIQKALESYKLSYLYGNRLASISYPNQTAEKSTFDPLGRLIEKKLPDTELTYTYDKSSMITVRNDTAYTYDELCRLIRAGENTYLYDISGNRIDDEQSLIDPITNRLMQRGDETYQYDTLGRLIEKKTPSTITEYTYNIEGYLGAYIRYDGLHQEVLVSIFFIYDPLGRRLSKHYKSSKETYHHRYLYAGDNIVAIYDNDTDELLATLLHEEGIDTPLSISRYDKPTLSTWEMEKLDPDEHYLYEQTLIHTCYYHRDHQNSIIALTNKEREIVESYSYDAFGNITQHTKTLETYNPYGYTGREADTDDLYYYRARYYDPTLGRFITPDPIGFAGGDTNFYRYVGNDPVNFVDPSGLVQNGTPSTSVLDTLSNTFDNFNKGVQNFFSPNPNKSATVNKGDGGKIVGTASKDCMITNAYFAKRTKQEVVDGTANYVFEHNNNTSGTHKKQIAKVIYEKVKSAYGDKYPTKASIEEALTKDSYNAGEKITFKLYKKQEVSLRITEASIGEKVTLVATLGGCPAGQNVTFKIYEKSPMLTTAGKELIMLKDGAELTEVSVASKGTFAVVEVELRPKKDKKSSATDTSPSLELWQEKFKHDSNTAEKFDHLWLKVSSPSAKNSPADYLKGSELKVKGCQELLSIDEMKLIFEGASQQRIQEYHPVINQALCLFNHNNRKSIAYFLGQCAAETGNLVYTSELGNEAYFSQYDGRDDLGNNQSGDGSRFRGRGMIQITGRTNYSNFETYVRSNIPKYASLDVTSSKDKATQIATNLELGVLASLWYWVYGEKSQKIANSVNSDDIYWVSVYVNGRKVQAHPYYADKTTEPNHMGRRIEATEKAKHILGV